MISKLLFVSLTLFLTNCSTDESRVDSIETTNNSEFTHDTISSIALPEQNGIDPINSLDVFDDKIEYGSNLGSNAFKLISYEFKNSINSEEEKNELIESMINDFRKISFNRIKANVKDTTLNVKVADFTSVKIFDLNTSKLYLSSEVDNKYTQEEKIRVLLKKNIIIGSDIYSLKWKKGSEEYETKALLTNGLLIYDTFLNQFLTIRETTINPNTNKSQSCPPGNGFVCDFVVLERLHLEDNFNNYAIGEASSTTQYRWRCYDDFPSHSSCAVEYMGTNNYFHLFTGGSGTGDGKFKQTGYAVPGTSDVNLNVQYAFWVGIEGWSASINASTLFITPGSWQGNQGKFKSGSWSINGVLLKYN